MLKEAVNPHIRRWHDELFRDSGEQSAAAGSPIWHRRHPGACGTGVIGISGTRQGIVYFTASRGMLTAAHAKRLTPARRQYQVIRRQANTPISGNARRDFGKNFVISVPIVIAHDVEKVTHHRRLTHSITGEPTSAKLVNALSTMSFAFRTHN